MKEEKDLLENLKSELEKKSKGTHISILSKSQIAKIDSWLDTPSYDLNRITSGSLFKGIPSKSFVLLAGPEASFKSSCMAIIAGKAQKENYIPVIIDTEGSWTIDFTQRWGLDPEKTLYIYTPWIDEIMVMLGKIIENKNYSKLVLIIDSIGGLERLKLLSDASAGDVKADQGTLQKDIKRMLKMLVNIAKSKDSLVLAGGHLYGNPSQYGEPEQLGGGKYLRHAADIIYILKKWHMKDGEKNIYGTGVSMVTRKNRYYPPYQEATIEIDYQKGINRYSGLLDIALEAGIVKGGGAGWYTITKTNEKFQGASKFESLVTDDMLNELDQWIKSFSYSSINKDIAEAEELLRKSEEYKEGEEEWLQKD